MPDQQYHAKTKNVGRGTSKRLDFLGNLSNCLAAASDPAKLLKAAFPEILAQLDAAAGRLLVQRPGAAGPECVTAVRWSTRTEAGAVAVARFAGAPVGAAGQGDPGGPEDRPLAVIELRSRAGAEAFDADDAAFVRAAAGLASMALANAALNKRLEDQLRIGDSLELAAELQQSLQPDCEPGRMPIWGVNLPARKVSGDFFDFYRLDEQRVAFALGDVSGKGMNAALLMAKAVSLFRCLGKAIDSPARLLESINAELCETAARGMFVTMVAGHYWIANGAVCFANAGHQPPLLRRTDRSYATFPAKAPPLGILPSIDLADERIELEGGEFYIFTDGLTEYRYSSGEQLGVEGLIQLIESSAEAPLAHRLEALLETLDQDSGWEARDDLTVLAIDDSWVRADGGIDEASGTADRGGESAAVTLLQATP